MLVGFRWSMNLGSSHWKTTKISCLVAHHTSASSSACGPSPLSSGRRIAFRRVAEIPAASKIRCDRLLPTHDFSSVYLGGLEVIVRKKISPELPVQRSAHERLVKACDKLGISLNPRKRLVDAAMGPVLDGELDGRLRHLCHERKTSAEMLVKTIIIIGALGWSVGALQHFAGLWGFAMSCRRPLFAVLSEVYGAIREHVSLLLEVLSCCALLPFAQTVISCSDPSIAGGSAVEATVFAENLENECHICQLSSCGASPISACPEKPELVFVCFPLFSCSPAVLLVSPRLSPEIQGILAVAGMRLVVTARATGRPHSLTYPHRTGGSTSGSANFVLSTGGRLEVVQCSGVRTLKQEMWRACVCVVLWRCAASDHCIRKPFFLLSQLHRCMR